MIAVINLRKVILEFYKNLFSCNPIFKELKFE